MLNITARQELISKILDTLMIVVEDARFDFEEDGLTVRVVDSSHVAMIKLTVDAAAFDGWELDAKEIGLEMKKIREVTTLGASGDLIEISHQDGGDFTMSLGKIVRNLRPLDNATMASPPSLPKLELPCKIVMNGAELGQALKAAKQVGDLVTFSIDESSFKVHVRNNTDSVNISFDKDEMDELVCDGAARSQYSLTYLEPLSRRFGPSDNVTIQFGENFPLAMNFTFEDGAAEVDYFLAPRVESDY
ncbi:MAG: hypothetical protein CMA41_00160 [Euryarchaeota archaeon]|jgi:proliferating cell nuclear antigen|nr:hypothetical protein [Euryarchaeota archaeon]CAI8268942.1 MAG: Uncharacterised protein [Euryarchaeota archaeon UBA443]|tara:strand:+ start:7527 stop:8267 length:741 start_codon:yes stop_codon:yes gene_type:complete